MLGLSSHALRQMRARDITETEVEEALETPESTYAADEYPDERVVILGSTKSGRPLKVVVEAQDHGYVITVADRSDER